MVNNDYTHWEMYAIGGSANPTINSQGNRYLAPVNPFAKEVLLLLTPCTSHNYFFFFSFFVIVHFKLIPKIKRIFNFLTYCYYYYHYFAFKASDYYIFDILVLVDSKSNQPLLNFN